MAVFKKIGSGAIFALAVLALLLCVTGVIGSWFAKASVDEASLAAIDLVSRLVGLAGQILDNLDGGLSETEQKVVAFQIAVESLRNGEADGPQAQLLQRTVGEELLPRLERLSTTAERLHTGLESFNEAVNQLNTLPFVDLPPAGDDLAVISQRIAEAGEWVEELRTGIARGDGSRMLAVSQRLAERLVASRSSLGATRERLTATQAALANVHEQLTFWSTVGTGTLNALLLLFAAGQASLAVHAWAWMRAPTGQRGGKHALPRSG